MEFQIFTSDLVIDCIPNLGCESCKFHPSKPQDFCLVSAARIITFQAAVMAEASESWEAVVPKRAKRSAAVAGKKPSVFEVWAPRETRDLVVSFCPPSPSQQFNQIAVADRLFNTSWRRRTYPLCKDMLRSAIEGLLGTCAVCGHTGSNLLLLFDLEDVFNTELATAAAEANSVAADLAPCCLRWSDAFAGYTPRWHRFLWGPPQACTALGPTRLAPQSPAETDSNHGASSDS